MAYVATGSGGGGSAWSQLDEDERRARNLERATKRAKGITRRYLVGNRLRYMWVLTFPGEGIHDAEGRAACMAEVASFAERFTRAFGRQAYWYSPEVHPGGHGWHVNFFVGRRVPHARMAELWDHGWVWVKDWVKDSRVTRFGLPLVAAIRLGAVYGCKYASKDWGEDVLVGGAHRYEVAQGFQPPEWVERVATLAEAFAFVADMFDGHAPSSEWCSDQAERWDGPPDYCWTFDTGLRDPAGWRGAPDG